MRLFGAGGKQGGLGMFAFRVPVGSFLRVSLILAATAGTSAADSVIALPDAKSDTLPSVVSRGEAEPAPIEAWQTETASLQDNGEAVLVLGSSVIAFGADAIPVSRDEVASVAEDDAPSAEEDAEAMPLALRGAGDGDGLVSLAD
ncbi:hypothetical protein [Neoaquamicrobium sediminum]|uniref:hypothetical protein n=1 Tax=Neoaquamicrobium sediminum TaxID=1849104 RepID=UPI003BAA342F